MPADTPPPDTLNDGAPPPFSDSTPLPQPTQQQNEQNHHHQQQQQIEQQQNEQQQVAAIGHNTDANTVQSHPPKPHNDELLLNNQSHDAVLSHDLEESDTEDPPSEFAYVDILAIRKEVQCPICLGIIKKTRTVMECLHRFCRECIDKSMRMGNNECPACRTHCASRRSLRDDPRFDELIASIYPDIKKFEEEELAFYEEDDCRNKQIQESISHIIIKQTEALGKKRSGSKDTSGPSAARSQRAYRSTQPRRRRGRRRNSSVEYRDSDDNNDANESDKYLSPDEYHQELNQRKRKRGPSTTSSQSPSTTNLSGGSVDNNLELSKEEKAPSPGLTCSPEMLAWGKGGVRSNARLSNVNDGVRINARRTRLTKLVDFLRNMDENDNESMALEKPLKAENEMLGMQDHKYCCDHQSTVLPSPCENDQPSLVAEPLQDKLQILGGEEKLCGPVSTSISNTEKLSTRKPVKWSYCDIHSHHEQRVACHAGECQCWTLISFCSPDSVR